VKSVRIISALFSFAAASAAFAHPGHPSFGPVHSYGETELGAIALILVVVVALGAIGVRRGPLRLRDRLTRFRKD
jgi:hypothetical protein